MIKIIIIFIWKYLICLEKWNIANDGLVGREQERWSDSQWQQFSVWHTTSTWFGIRGGDVRRSRTEFTAQNFRHTNSLNRFLPSCKKKKSQKKTPNFGYQQLKHANICLSSKLCPHGWAWAQLIATLRFPAAQKDNQVVRVCKAMHQPRWFVHLMFLQRTKCLYGHCKGYIL